MQGLLISNLYPSKDFPARGTFVKVFEESLKKHNIYFNNKVVLDYKAGYFKKITQYFLFFLRVIRFVLLPKSSYDFVYVHYLNHSVIPFILLRKFLRKPLFLNAHGSDIFPENIQSRFLKTLTSPVVHTADRIVVPSSYYREQILKAIPRINPKNIIIYPSGGIDTDKFSYKSALVGGDKHLKIGFAGRLEFGKGWEILLESFKIFSQDNSAKLLIVGDGNQKKRFFRRVNELNLSNVVDYIGVLAHEDMPSFYHELDVFVFPTYRVSESLGLVGLEAMSSGVPLIASKVGGIRDYLIDGYNGYFFQPRNHHSLTQALLKFSYMSQDAKQTMTKNARNTALEYSSGKVTSRLAKQIREIL